VTGSTPDDLRRSPLDAEHRALGARMVPFGGWDMPIQYAGVVEEHLACRSDAVVFDVSHLGTVRCTGSGAFDSLQWAFTNDLRRIEPGRAQYTHLLDPEDAHVVDDIIVWWVAPDDFAVMPNAANTDRLVAALSSATGDITCRDVTAERAVLAVQGPHARERLATVNAQAAAVARFDVRPVDWDGAACLVAGTGYTGEDGVEIQVPVASCAAVWRQVVGAGITPAGLGARDTLRLEAGLPLHGHELGPGITPLQAGLGWVVRWDKGDFRGRAALEAERERGVARRLRGLASEGRRPPREGCDVRVGEQVVGVVTSGNFSPILGHGIALALLDAGVEEGDEVVIDVRGKDLPARVTGTRFLR
jgi:glycine cleavage system T protein (aminomethyltransferase)